MLLEEYRNRINNYENCIQKNGILRQFVENWRFQVKQNKELVAFPSVIKNLYAFLKLDYICLKLLLHNSLIRIRSFSIFSLIIFNVNVIIIPGMIFPCRFPNSTMYKYLFKNLQNQ